MNNKIITFDMETLLLNGLYYPFIIGVYDELNFKYFYLDSFTDNNIYQIKLYNKLTFHDSLKIICRSLKDASEAYNIEHKKKEIDYNLFILDKIFENEIKNEIIEYLKYDCISLYEIMKFFTNKIYEDYNLKCSNYLTIASLSFKIWRTTTQWPLEANTNTNQWKDTYLRASYFGGRCEIYKPCLDGIGFYYDVNSLYPFIMKNYEFPIGTGTFFVWKKKNYNINNFFGFLRCNITSPKNIYIPVLPYRDENSKVYYPTGSWKGVYFIHELLLAIKHNYIIEPIDGIKYEKANIFYDFIDLMYTKRLMAKNKAENTYYKLIMNSLSGKFAMLESDKIVKMVTMDEYYSLWANTNINIDKIQELNENLIILTYEDHSINKKRSNINSHVQISSAITSYARCYMYNFINNNRTYYTDTDSLVTTDPLDPELVSINELGKFKLEHTLKSGYFISQKCYFLTTATNQKIIKFKSLKTDFINSINEDFFKSYLFVTFSHPFVEILEYYKIKRNWSSFNVVFEKLNAKYTLPYTKRKKIYIKKKWVDSKPWYIIRKQL
jgi:DNA polymerase type B, organellar and viral